MVSSRVPPHLRPPLGERWRKSSHVRPGYEVLRGWEGGDGEWALVKRKQHYPRTNELVLTFEDDTVYATQGTGALYCRRNPPPAPPQEGSTE